MRKPVAWLVSWALYWAGGLVSRWAIRANEHRYAYGLWDVCQTLTRWSGAVQDWGGAGPWNEGPYLW